MGCVHSRNLGAATKRDISLSRSIDIQLDLDRESQIDNVKLLLLGTGESGKSTVFKQLRLLYGNGYTIIERQQFLLFMRQNSIETMEKLCVALYKKEPTHTVCSSTEFMEICEDPNVDASSKNFESYHKYPSLTMEKAVAIEKLWSHEAIKNVWENRSGLHVIDSAYTFFDKIREVAEDDFLPSEEDILKIRIRTAGMREERFQIQNKNVQIFDLGGQRSERRKWYHAFSNVHAIIFLAAISEYDVGMWEDPECNRLQDSLNLFGKLVNEPCFRDTTFIIFFNKFDLFKGKILAGARIADVEEWSDYKGNIGDVDAGIDYFTEKFKARLSTSGDTGNRDVKFFVTCATDREVMSKIMKSVEPVLVNRAIDSLGIV